MAAKRSRKVESTKASTSYSASASTIADAIALARAPFQQPGLLPGSEEQPASRRTAATPRPGRKKRAPQDSTRGVEVAPLTIFRWGYEGWGSSVPELLDVTGRIETSRGFRPLVFVDVRFHRSVRAAGFRDRVFEKTLGADRYVWLPSLGNAAIGRRDGTIEINDPRGADDLLDKALELRARQQRVIFFCSCGSPEHCHRVHVERLLLATAKRRHFEVEVAEWPGGEPSEKSVANVVVTKAVFQQLLRDRTAVPLTGNEDVEALAGLPWGSIITVSDGMRSAPIAVGPAAFRAGAWSMPLFIMPVDAGDDVAAISGRVPRLRKQLHYAVMR